MRIKQHAKRVRLFRAEAEEREDWKRKYDEVKRLVFELEDTIQFGLFLFEALQRLDCEVRFAALADPSRKKLERIELVRGFFRDWLAAGKAVDLRIQLATDAGFAVKDINGAEELRSKISEMEWILNEHAFDRPEFVDLRDEAIDELRAS